MTPVRIKMSKITVENVSYVYSAGTPFEVKALDDINLSIEENRITGIIGHTGSGKSTLVQMFNGLVRPDEGRILLDGADIWENPKEIGKVRFKVGLVMQYPECQLFEETVKADIAFGPKNMGLDEDEIKNRVSECAGFVGLGQNELDKSPFDLSGGQKRRAAIAGVMAMKPEVLVLDEPAAGLDPAGRASIFDGIVKYKNSTGAAVIIVSHSMEDMAKYCDYLIVMADAKVFMTGDRDTVFSNSSQLENIGLDIPQITKVMTLLCEAGVNVSKSIYTVEDAERALLKLFGGVR